MDLLTFISDPARKRRLAALTKSSEGYLWQIATGWRNKRASPELAQVIEKESAVIGPEGVPKELLRPDIWPGTESMTARRTPAAPEGGDAAQADAVPVQPVSEAA